MSVGQTPAGLQPDLGDYAMGAAMNFIRSAMAGLGMETEICCCSSEGDITTSASDMVNPNIGKALFMADDAMLTVGTDELEHHGDSRIRYEPSSASTARRQLLTAVRNDDAPEVLQNIADGANVADIEEGLRLAAHRGSASVVRELVAIGMSVNGICPRSGFTPMQLASAGGDIVICELLLDAMADVRRAVGGATPLEWARQMGHTDVEEIIERHLAVLTLQEKGDGTEDAQNKRAHVLPRVSEVLTEAVLQALPKYPHTKGIETTIPTAAVVAVVPTLPSSTSQSSVAPL